MPAGILQVEVVLTYSCDDDSVACRRFCCCWLCPFSRVETDIGTHPKMGGPKFGIPTFYGHVKSTIETFPA